MKTYNILKVNLAKKGYSQIWTEGTKFLDMRIVDESLPVVNSDSGNTPNMAYAVNRISKDKVFIAFGFFWSEFKDEYSRSGLFFWHGILCVFSENENNPQLLIANVLLGLMSKYQVALKELGDIISKVAIEENSEGELKKIIQLSAELPNDINERTEILVSAFLKNKVLPTKANIKTRFPFHENLAISCLIGLMFQQGGITKFAGGNLPSTDLNAYQYISTLKEISGYPTVDVSKYLSGSDSKALFGMENNSLVVTLGTVLIFCLILAFVTFIFLRPLIQLLSK